MQKYFLGLIVLAFVAGAGLSAVILWRTNPSVQEGSPSDSKSENLSQKEQQKKDIESDEEHELDGNYGDPSTCADLLNANTYKNDEDYMYMLAGKSPWVFRTRQDLQMAFEIEQKDIALYQKLSEVLRGTGTELLISYIPTRAMIAGEFLPEGSEFSEDYDMQSARENYAALITRMNEVGVFVVGTPDPSVGAVYFNHADQHWTTQGAREMAKTLAQFIKKNGFDKDLPVQTYKTEQGEEISYDGRFGEFIERVCGFRPQPEKDYKVKTERIDADEEALLGDEAVPSVVLVGTSNSIRDEFNSNFAGYLKEALSADVYNAAISGGGMDDAILAYLGSDLFRKNPPKILIWELPGYYDLGGNAMEFALRQAIASAMGDCDRPVAQMQEVLIEGKRLPLFEGLQNISASQAYIALAFNEEIAKDFTISIKTGDGKNEKFKFKKRREDNSSKFYYWPKGEDELLGSVTLNVNKNIEGKKVSAKLCPFTP